MGGALNVAAIAAEEAVLYPIHRHGDVAAAVAPGVDTTLVADDEAVSGGVFLFKGELEGFTFREVCTRGYIDDALCHGLYIASRFDCASLPCLPKVLCEGEGVSPMASKMKLDNPSALRTVFLRGLALVYLCAFLSLLGQVGLLYGPDGILPIDEVLQHFEDSPFALRWGRFPTLLWWTGASASVLKLTCLIGAGSAVLLFLGVVPKCASFFCWFAYLSLVTPSRVFLNFQWDVLLLEVGFLALCWAPISRSFQNARWGTSSVAGLWLLRWLLFRLMFASGVAKLASGDQTWWDLAALSFHFETQPLPTWIAWHLHQLDPVLLRSATAVMFGIELVLPFFIFGPPRFRRIAAVGFLALQSSIALSGNYGFFNLLTGVLCLSLFDEVVFSGMKSRLRSLISKLRPGIRTHPGADSEGSNVSRAADPPGASLAPLVETPLSRMGNRGVVALALVLALAGAAHLASRFLGTNRLPAFGQALIRVTAPWHLSASYGLFATMTTVRREIELQGSLDGETWQAYEFHWKPGDPSRKPGFVQPHQPRLDWQMWFAALSGPRHHSWLLRYQQMLLDGSGPALKALAENPFSDSRPRYIRAVLYDYRLTTAAERKDSGLWWIRRKPRLWSPVQRLSSD